MIDIYIFVDIEPTGIDDVARAQGMQVQFEEEAKGTRDMIQVKQFGIG